MAPAPPPPPPAAAVAAGDDPPPPPRAGATRDAAWFLARGFDRPVGVDAAGPLSKMVWGWANPLIARGVAGTMNDATAEAFTSAADDAAACEAAFDAVYARLKADGVTTHLLHRTLFTLHSREMAAMAAWTVVEVGCRLGSALLLRAWVGWLTATQARPGGASAPAWHGWAYAAALCVVNGFYAVVVHHQLFGIGMKAGYIARQRVVTAIHAKLLRLNAGAAAALGGKIVNLASSDVRRLEDAGPFWPFLVAAPAELAAVTALLARRLGAAPAVVGVAPILLFLPLQAALSRRIGRLRTSVAAQTDARARVMAEAVHGALAVKMLSLEGVVGARVREARAREAAPTAAAARIRAVNEALFFCIYPLAVFFLMLAVWATRRRPSVADIFFALALLRLPQLYFGIFFIKAVETASELAASLTRLDAFLSLPEPPPPPHAAPPPAGADAVGADIAVAFRGCDFLWPPAVAPADGGAKQQSPAKEAADAASPRVVVVAAGDAAADTATAGSPPASPTAGSPLHHRLSVDGRPVGGPALECVSLAVKRGELVGIAGDVGAGKSALLLALLAELDAVGDPDTRPLVRGSVSYCAQVPWIVSGTLRFNVTGFAARAAGGDDDAAYAAALDAACLGPDIAALPGGDATEIGERGVNLSGGQRARVALARAAYARADVALLDDPLSALDARVGAAVFDRCIGPGGALDGTTRLLVTHARHYLPRCDRVVVLRGGRVAHCDTPAALAAAGVPELAPGAVEAPPVSVDDAADAADGAAAAAAAAARITLDDAPGGDSDDGARGGGGGAPGGSGDGASAPAGGAAPLAAASKRRVTVVAPASVFSTEPLAVDAAGRRRRITTSASGDDAAARLRRSLTGLFARGGRLVSDAGDGTASVTWRRPLAGLLSSFRLSRSRRTTSDDGGAGAGGVGGGAPPPPRRAAPPGALTADEGRAEGGVALAVYGAWLARLGWAPCAAVVVALVAGQAAYLFAEFLAAALGAVADPATAARVPPGTAAVVAGRPVSATTWLALYGGITAALVVVAVLRAALWLGAAVAAATRLHDDMAAATLRAPLAFYHTTPAGRILNRFTKDQGIADDYLPTVSFDALQCCGLVVGALAMMAAAVPQILPVFAPLALAFAYFRRRYLAATRDVKRFDGTTRSPVFAALGETPRGLATVRAYGAAASFQRTFAGLAGRNLSWWAAFVACARNLGVRLDAVATAALVAEAALLTALARRVDPRLAGLALTNCIGLAGALQWAVRQVAEWEVSMTSVERMLEVTRVPAEPPTLALGGPAPPAGWPPHGGVEFDGVTAVYRPGLPAVLVDVTLAIPPGTSVGVCGRTGSGKSSLLLALFRLIPVTRGVVRVGGVDAASIALDALRAAIAVIPQDPVLFSGSLRSNLDPAGAHPDAALWAALDAARLKGAARRLGGLGAPVAEAGANLSVGERQLLCLARALLADAAVLALDEATANVDAGTDAAVGDALARARGAASAAGRTLIVIAHRVDTVMALDSVVVLGGGRVLEAGPPRDLAAGGGAFARLVRAAVAARGGG